MHNLLRYEKPLIWFCLHFPRESRLQNKYVGLMTLGLRHNIWQVCANENILDLSDIGIIGSSAFDVISLHFLLSCNRICGRYKKMIKYCSWNLEIYVPQLPIRYDSQIIEQKVVLLSLDYKSWDNIMLHISCYL